MGGRPSQPRPLAEGVLPERSLSIVYGGGTCRYQLSSFGWYALTLDTTMVDDGSDELSFIPGFIIVRGTLTNNHFCGTFRIPANGRGDGTYAPRTATITARSMRMKQYIHNDCCSGLEYAMSLSPMYPDIRYGLITVEGDRYTHHMMQDNDVLQTWTSEYDWGIPYFITWLGNNRWMYLRTDRSKGDTQINVVEAMPKSIITRTLVSLKRKLLPRFWDTFIVVKPSGIVYIMARYCNHTANGEKLPRETLNIIFDSAAGVLLSETTSLACNSYYFDCVIPPHDDEVNTLVDVIILHTTMIKPLSAIITSYLFSAML